MDETQHNASLCILASGSEGNCSVLRMETANGSRIALIDAGLSPRRTRRLLGELGLGLEHLEAIILTHLDRDHWHVGWLKGLPECVAVWAHKRHAARGRRREILPRQTRAFDEVFELGDAGEYARVSAALASHDDMGVAAFRFEVPSPGRGNGGAGPGVGAAAGRATLGFATDVGRMREHLIEHLRDVDVLAIESNYCPLMQAASARPWFLKRRITGGHGHLSNEEAVEAVRAIRPRSHVILLHLSRECNDPHLVASLHDGSPYRCIITSQVERTEWVPLSPALRDCAGGVICEPGAPTVQPSLFGGMPSPAAAMGDGRQAGAV